VRSRSASLSRSTVRWTQLCAPSCARSSPRHRSRTQKETSRGSHHARKRKPRHRSRAAVIAIARPPSSAPPFLGLDQHTPPPSDGPLRHVAAPPFLGLDQHTPPPLNGPLLDATPATPTPATASHRTTSPSRRRRRTRCEPATPAPATAKPLDDLAKSPPPRFTNAVPATPPFVGLDQLGPAHQRRCHHLL
jgi:hypothetical protein